MHPVEDLLEYYYNEFPKFKQEHTDLSNVEFNKNYGLFINGPLDWPYNSAIELLVNKSIAKSEKVIVIYSSTEGYDLVSGYLSPNSLLTYLSWQEIFVAMSRAHNDMRSFAVIRERLSNAGLVIFVGATQSIIEVLDQVRGFTEGCLIFLG